MNSFYQISDLSSKSGRQKLKKNKTIDKAKWQWVKDKSEFSKSLSFKQMININTLVNTEKQRSGIREIKSK